MEKRIVNIIVNCTSPSNDQMKVVREIRKQVPSLLSTYTSEIIGAVKKEINLELPVFEIDTAGGKREVVMKDDLLALLDKFIEK